MADAVSRRITIVGGGFSGVSAALQLVRASASPLVITIVEPRARAGPGLAYSATDPDHRLNGTTGMHSVVPDDAGHFTRWCETQAIFRRDPQAVCADGSAFARRADYGDYLAATLRAHAAWPATGSTISHLRDRAIGAARSGDALVTFTEAGHSLGSTLLIVATGNPLPRLQPPLERSLAAHPSIVENPLEPGRLREIDPRARVLVLGSGLTAVDAVSTLVREDHRGEIVVVSRRGLRSRSQPPASRPDAVAPAGQQPVRVALPPLDRILGPLPAFLPLADGSPTLLGWLRALRRRIGEVQAQGESWHQGFDELRDVVWRAWPLLPIEQKRRFLRTLRTWYDAHRFRVPPQNDALVRAAEARGRVRFHAARLRSVEAIAERGPLRVRMIVRGDAGERVEMFDSILNCTGLDVTAGARSNPFLASLVEQGWLRVDDTGIGFAVDAQCRAIGIDGQAAPALRVIGPPTAGTFGDPLGAMFIAAQIHRILPDALAALARPMTAPVSR